MSDIFKIKISRTDMALYAQDVENNYMGIHCGIMDQLIIAKGVKDKALLMDTKTYETESVNAFFQRLYLGNHEYELSKKNNRLEI